MSLKWLLLPVVFGLSACSTMKPEQFAGAEPRLVIEDYFLGDTQAWGIFEDRSGALRRQFTVQMRGSLDGDTLVLEEDFCYADGEKDRRVWRIRRLDEHRYEGRADDVIGVAAGTAYGNALNWRYRLNLTVGDRSWEVSFDDWMYLQPGDVLVNRARMSKFGFTLGEVTLFFHKPAPDAAPICEPPATASS